MIEVAVALLCGFTAVAALYGIIPWMTKCGSLYLLHNLRDTLYDMGADVSGARDTFLYRDVEFLVTRAIHSVRDQDYGDAVATLARCRRRQQPHAIDATNPANPRTTQYRHELDTVFASDAGSQALKVMQNVIEGVPAALVLRVTFGHPVALAAVLTLFPLSVLKDWLRRPRRGTPSQDDEQSSEASPETKLSEAVSVETGQTMRPGALGGIRASIDGMPRAVSRIRRDRFGSEEVVA